jgi:hypothetical protein
MKMRDLYRELNESSDALRESWKPNPGDLIAGTVQGYETAEGKFGPVTLLILAEEDESGKPTGSEVTVWLAHKVLWDEVRKLKPRIGERIGIRRLEDNATKGYARYRVIVDREDGQDSSFVPNFDEPDPVKTVGERSASTGSLAGDGSDGSNELEEPSVDNPDDLPF